MKWSIFSSFVAFAAIILLDSKVADSVKEKDIEVRNDHTTQGVLLTYKFQIAQLKLGINFLGLRT